MKKRIEHKRRPSSAGKLEEKRRIEELETILGECYQVIAALSDYSGINALKAMDNASRQKLIHHDVLPFDVPEHKRCTHCGMIVNTNFEAEFSNVKKD